MLHIFDSHRVGVMQKIKEVGVLYNHRKQAADVPKAKGDDAEPAHTDGKEEKDDSDTERQDGGAPEPEHTSRAKVSVELSCSESASHSKMGRVRLPPIRLKGALGKEPGHLM